MSKLKINLLLVLSALSTECFGMGSLLRPVARTIVPRATRRIPPARYPAKSPVRTASGDLARIPGGPRAMARSIAENRNHYQKQWHEYQSRKKLVESIQEGASNPPWIAYAIVMAFGLYSIILRLQESDVIKPFYLKLRLMALGTRLLRLYARMQYIELSGVEISEVELLNSIDEFATIGKEASDVCQEIIANDPELSDDPNVKDFMKAAEKLNNSFIAMLEASRQSRDSLSYLKANN